MSLTNIAQIAHGVNNYFDRRMLVKAKPALVHLRYAQVRDLPRNNTDVIKFTRYNLLSAATTPLTEGVTPTGSKLSKTDFTSTAKQYGRHIIAVSKFSLI